MSTLDLQGKKQRPGPQSALAGMLLCVGMLAAFGVIAGVSAAAPGEGWDSLRLHASHLLIGLVAFLAAYSIPTHRLRAVAPGLVMIVWIVLAAMLFTNFGHSSHAAERWVRIGGFSLQPSVLLQTLWPVLLASWAAKDPLRLLQPLHLIRLMAGFGLMVLPVLFQPDLGSVLILLGVTGITLFFAGVSLRFLRVLVPVAVLVLVTASSLFTHVSSRLEQFANREHGTQVTRALEAFQLGGPLGRGPGQGELGRVGPRVRHRLHPGGDRRGMGADRNRELVGAVRRPHRLRCGRSASLRTTVWRGSDCRGHRHDFDSGRAQHGGRHRCRTAEGAPASLRQPRRHLGPGAGSPARADAARLP